MRLKKGLENQRREGGEKIKTNLSPHFKFMGSHLDKKRQ